MKALSHALEMVSDPMVMFLYLVHMDSFWLLQV